MSNFKELYKTATFIVIFFAFYETGTSQTLIKDIIPGSGSSNARVVGVGDHYVYYTAASRANSTTLKDLYVYDTSNGSVRKFYSLDGTSQSFDLGCWFQTLGNQLIFTHDDSRWNSQLFSTDGEITIQIHLNPNDPPNPSPLGINPSTQQLYFTARTSRTINSSNLMVTEGTIPSTKSVLEYTTGNLIFPESGTYYQFKKEALELTGWTYDNRVISFYSIVGLVGEEILARKDYYDIGNRTHFLDTNSPMYYDAMINDSTWSIFSLDTAKISRTFSTEYKHTSFPGKFAGLLDYHPDNLLWYVMKDKDGVTYSHIVRHIISQNQTDTLISIPARNAPTLIYNTEKLPFTLLRQRTNENGTELIIIDRDFSTAMFYDLNPGIANSSPFLVGQNENFAFIRANTENGTELFVSDGTDVELKKIDVYPGEASQFGAYAYAEKGRKLYFTAQHPEYGNAIFVTDGTLEGTRLFYDPVPGNEGGEVGDLAIVQNYLYFSAKNEEYGYEPYRISLNYVYDSCSNVECPDGYFCYQGNCYTYPDACTNIDCPVGHFCYEGACYRYDECLNVDCPDGQVCLNGSCYDPEVDLCDGVECPAGKICKNGECYIGCSFDIDCPEGTVCMTDICVPIEDICAHTLCPEGQFCYAGACYYLSTNINEITNHTNPISVFPNPSSGRVMITSEKSLGAVRVRIRDILGRTILQKQVFLNQGETISIADLQPNQTGYKIIEITQNGKLIQNDALIFMPK